MDHANIGVIVVDDRARPLFANGTQHARSTLVMDS